METRLPENDTLFEEYHTVIDVLELTPNIEPDVVVNVIKQIFADEGAEVCEQLAEEALDELNIE
jgi:hypothetical protein